MEVESYVDKGGEWREKKISIVGVVQGFISQLKVGQDMTRVSLPAILLYPFSMLEVIAHRETSTIDALFKVNHTQSSLERMLHVVAWYLSVLPTDQWRKKPYNPVLGEIHHVVTQGSADNTYFLAEQVSHHPPITAVHIHNSTQQISVAQNLSFGVTFGGNTLSIVMSGGGQITCEKLKENYMISKMFPNLAVKHLVIGHKKVLWEGDITITCPESQITAELNFGKSDNSVKGSILQGKQILAQIEGTCGGIIHWIQGKDKKTLIDIEKAPKAKLRSDATDSLSSLNIWSQVTKNIVEDKANEADEIKKKVEDDQRKRIAAEGPQHHARYFEFENNFWKIKSAALNSSQFGH